MNRVGQNMVHKLVIFWSYYGQNMEHVYIVANYGQNTVHKMGKIWANFGPISDKVLRVLVVYGICDK